MRPIDLLLVALSGLIILLVGLLPLFGGDNHSRTVREECELFYGSSGPAGVEHCIAEMKARHAISEMR